MFSANLNCFQDNPWQPRKTMRQDRLEELAAKIYALKATRPETRGLLQMPAARLVDAENKPVPLALVSHLIPVKGDLTKFLKEQKFHLQLAWGHRRRAAFELLTKGLFIPPLEGDTSQPLIDRVVTDVDYQLFPFELVAFSDQEMFELAVTENGDRDDLTTIETAQAMVTYRDQFGRSSAEIGKLFGGMSGSTVRNMIRLLDLPDEPRQALAEGKMSQGAGRALLSLYALPKEIQGQRIWAKGEYWTGAEIAAKAMEGGLASDIEGLINELINHNAKNMSDCRWKAADVFPELEGIHHPDCKTCPARVARNGTHYCLIPTCYRAKRTHWTQDYLTQAGRASDLPVFDGQRERSTKFDYSERHPVLDAAYEKRCPNLRIAFNENALDRHGKGYEKTMVIGFPGAEMVCCKMEQHCTCLQAHKAGIQFTPNFAPLPEIDENYDGEARTSEAAAPVTTDDLKEINREIRAQKQQAKQQITALRQAAAQQLYEAFSTDYLPAWKKLAAMIWDFGHAGDDAPDLETLFQRLAAHLIEREFKYASTEDNYDLAHNEFEIHSFMDELHLPHVSIETPAGEGDVE